MLNGFLCFNLPSPTKTCCQGHSRTRSTNGHGWSVRAYYITIYFTLHILLRIAKQHTDHLYILFLVDPVNTRCIYLDAKKQDAADNIALAPMLDFLNHTPDAKTEGRFCTKTKSYQIKTLLPYKKGEQVFINYGPHDNCFILVVRTCPFRIRLNYG